MRAGVWWSAAALTLLALASALRTQQGEGASRVGRRISAPSAPETRLDSPEPEDVQPTFRQRSSRRREETPPREVSRSRTRSRPAEAVETERPQSKDRNERFDSRRTYSRTRNRPVENEDNKDTPTVNVVRSRTRQSIRRPPSTQAPLELTSPTIDESKIEVVNANFDDVPKSTPKLEDVAPTQFRRRSSTSVTTETVIKRTRKRINARPSSSPLDLNVSGTTNTLYKEPTTAQNSADLRNPRKLRYRTRQLETDTNLTGEGIIVTNEVTKSSQNQEIITSQPEPQTAAPIVVADTVQPSTDSSLVSSSSPTTSKTTKVLRRPLARGKANFRPAVSLPKLTKPSDEISEDDNYPESFKALLQAKNASTQTSSPPSESLSVKASQKVYKTYSSSVQSTNNGPAKTKHSRFRSRQNAEEDTKKEDSKADDHVSETTSVPDRPKARTVTEYKPRGTYTPRARKASAFTTSTTAASVSSSTRKSLYKFNRKFKGSTISTEAPSTESTIKDKRFETSNLLKKSLARPSYYSRRNSPKNITNPEPTVTSEIHKIETNNSKAASNKSVLPKTSYYTRLRNKTKTNISSIAEPVTEGIKEEEQMLSDKRNKEPIDMPLIFSLLNNPSERETTKKAEEVTQQPDKQKEVFIIAVSSKESDENNIGNEVANRGEESENQPIVDTMDTTVKYHATYKNKQTENEPETKEAGTPPSSTPAIRNIQTRKYGRSRLKAKEVADEQSTVTPKPRDRSLRKYSDSFSKTTEPTTNGIPPDEKHKSRYSSKYKASYLDKPFYKATVPTITQSTAWLKFFVTDHELAKSVEEPKWFDGEDIYDVTTEMTNLSVTPSNTHESSLELVEGEEFQIGPDMNAISFTMPRSTLSSADLKLSESLMKSSQIRNLETSQHSGSVTISIFDALAEILTSTPRTPRLSTTEVISKLNMNTDIKQTLNGVSNSITVNNVRGLAGQDTFTSPNADVNVVTKSVQQTDQTTPIVNNHLSVGESATPSLNNEGGNVTPVNTPTFPTPTPATPVSARRPFAIRVLYSDTESPTDKLSTATVPTSNQPSTDSPTTVYSTVSDLLLTNNNLVSFELTSMLSNNIKNIIQNMDENTRSKISGDMAKLLRSLIPRALNRLTTANDDLDMSPNTTPYSLEEIKDTEITNLDSNNSSVNIDTRIFDSLQTVDTPDNVNITTIDVSNSTTEYPILAVNSSNVSQGIMSSTISVSSSQTPPADSTLPPTSLNGRQAGFSASYLNPTSSTDKATASDSSDTSIGSTTNMNIPIPFLTNAEISDFTINDPENLDSNVPVMQMEPFSLNTRSGIPLKDFNDINTDDPSQVSPLQLWVLSKKARVLKMIEDLIRQHNDELATAAPLTEMLNQENNIPLSSRLTQIINTMTSTTESTNSANENDSTSPMTTSSLTPIPLSTIVESQSNRPSTDFDIGFRSTLTTTQSTVASSDVASTTTQVAADILSRFGSADIVSTSVEPTTETTNAISSTTPLATAVEFINRTQEISSTIATEDETMQTTTQENTETTTILVDTETTQTDILTTISTDIETTTQADVEPTSRPSNETSQNIVSISNRLNVDTATIPKKDYVIFGILPNNTVVRKDPNDDILETLTEASPYIIYGVLPNNTVIRRFPNGTRVPRVMQKIDVLPISPWSLRNPYSPIHNNPAIVRPRSNPIRVSTNIVTSIDTSNGTDTRLTNDTVNNQQTMIPTSALNIKDSSSLGVTTNRPPAEKSTASHVLSLRTSTMLPSVDEILLNSISSAAKEEMVISSMTSSTHEPRILTLDIDPETQQIRTERPSDGNGAAVFKFIPIDEVTVAPQDTNVLKLASTKAPVNANVQTVTATMVTEINTQTPQIQTRIVNTESPTTTDEVAVGTPVKTNPVYTNSPLTTTESTTSPPIATMPPTTTVITTTFAPTTTVQTTTTTEATTTLAPTTTTPVPTTTTQVPTTTVQITTVPVPIFTSLPTNAEQDRKYEEDAQLIATLLQGTERNPKSLNVFTNANQIPAGAATTTSATTARVVTTQESEEAKLLKAILAANRNPTPLTIPNNSGNLRINTQQTTTSRSIEDDIKQFEEDTKLLKALLAATGQNPASLNIPSLDSINIGTRANIPTTTTARPTTTTPIPTTTFRIQTTTPSIDDDIKKFNEDAKLLQALLRAAGQNNNNVTPVISEVTTNVRTTPTPTTTFRIQTTTPSIDDDIQKFNEDAKLLQALLRATGQNNNNAAPVISGVTSNVRIASNPLTTSIGSNPTTPMNVRPVYTSRTTTPTVPVFTSAPVPVLPTLQPRTTTTEDAGISTTFPPKGRRRLPTTTVRTIQATATGRRAPSSRFTVTTEIPSTSTFSDEEDLLFLQNLKSVLNTNPDNEDPEAALANRIIALAVERSLNEIKSGQQADIGRTGKNLATTVPYRIPTTTTTSTTTTTTTTTTPRPTTTPQLTTTIKDNTPSIEDDIKQFQEDTKLLQALLKATGQDPSKFNIPTLPDTNTNGKVSLAATGANDDLRLLSNLLASPSPLNEPFDSLTPKPTVKPITRNTVPTTARPFGAKIAVKDDLKNVQDDAKLLQTLVKLQDVQETTTQRSKIALTGQSPDEALQKLIQQTNPTGMVSEATKTPMSISTEYGKSNDALLAALLKEQGFGPTTASSLDEQLRLAALLNQVVVTPKTRRTTTPPPPPPAPRRPILDGLAWLWQQWRETEPGPAASRPNRRPAASPTPAVSSSAATSNRVNWFGSGPFIGNADDRPANRIPLEPPRAVTAEQTPGRGQLVSAAINVTRAFSQFLGAAIQGAAQTVQSVIRAGQRAATDVYTNGSG